MPTRREECPVPPACALVLTEVNERLGRDYRWRRQLLGGEQSGAHLVAEGDRAIVLKWEPAGWKADQLLRAFPAVVHATDRGWPAARWLAVGPLAAGGAFLLQEYVDGVAVSQLDRRTVRAVVAANATQRGLALAHAPDDSRQLEAVLSGDDEWKSHVAGFTSAGAELVRHGDEVAGWAGPVPIPVTDVVHGDYSSANLLLDADGSAVTFVDCQTVGRGSRVRDLADLYRHSALYPSGDSTGLARLRASAVAIEGPRVFVRCVVAVTYNNLAWWVEHKPPAEFDQACARLHRLFDSLCREAPDI